MSKQHCRMVQVERFFRQCRMLLRQCCWCGRGRINCIIIKRAKFGCYLVVPTSLVVNYVLNSSCWRRRPWKIVRPSTRIIMTSRASIARADHPTNNWSLPATMIDAVRPADQPPAGHQQITDATSRPSRRRSRPHPEPFQLLQPICGSAAGSGGRLASEPARPRLFISLVRSSFLHIFAVDAAADDDENDDARSRRRTSTFRMQSWATRRRLITGWVVQQSQQQQQQHSYHTAITVRPTDAVMYTSPRCMDGACP